MTVALVAASALLAVAAVGALLLRRLLLIVTVNGTSMAPTYQAGDRLLARRWNRHRVHAGDVVVLSNHRLPPNDTAARIFPPSGRLVKRVAATPGDPVPRDRVHALRDLPETLVPPGRLVVLGDNAAVSADSRLFGYVRNDLVLAVVIRRLGHHP